MGVLQWRNTPEVLNWFKNITHRKTKIFFKFDIVSFYPSITKELLQKSMEFASEDCGLKIPKNEIEIIMHSCETFLFHDGKPWVKKGGRGQFDVPMGSFNGAEICEMVGLYILNAMTKGPKPIFRKNEVGLYRDDGLGVIPERGCSTRDLNRRLKKLFIDMGLSITTDTGMKCTDFLDVKLDLNNGEFCPFRKPNDNPLYIDINSDHPPKIKKQLKNMIQKRLSTLSSSKAVFDREKTIYETALKNAGHQHNLEYMEPEEPKKRKRRRKLLYYNPPYSSSIQTDIGRQFILLMEKHFQKPPPS